VSCPQRGAGRARPAPHEAQTRSGQTALCGHVRPESSTVSSCSAKDLKKAPAAYSQSPTCTRRGRRSAAAATTAHQTWAAEGFLLCSDPYCGSRGAAQNKTDWLINEMEHHTIKVSQMPAHRTHETDETAACGFMRRAGMCETLIAWLHHPSANRGQAQTRAQLPQGLLLTSSLFSANAAPPMPPATRMIRVRILSLDTLESFEKCHMEFVIGA
jgi:hypothetical protein